MICGYVPNPFKRNLWVCFVSFLLIQAPIAGEEALDWHQLLEELAENEQNTSEWEETLTELASNPIPLNSATREMLESVPFLTDDQVENLSYYLYRYGPMVSLSEILLVEGMDTRTLRWLKPFVCLGKATPFPAAVPPLKKAMQYGKHEFRVIIGGTFQQKAGFVEEADSSKKYVGNPLHLSARYGFDYKGKLQFGLVLEKDPGELMWNAAKGGIDYLSFHFLIKNQKYLNTLILGDYHLRFGQGLICSSNFSLGKSAGGCRQELTGPLLSRHFSSSEYNFFRGIASRVIIKPYVPTSKGVGCRFGIDLTTFASFRKLDAVVDDSSFGTISTSGLHRTIDETTNSKLLEQVAFGGHLNFRSSHLQWGLSGIHWSLNAKKMSSSECWRIFSIKGKTGGNLSVDFQSIWRGVFLYGEAALDQNGHQALLTGVSFNPYPRMKLSFLGRSYSKKYQTWFGNAFSEGTTTNNEQGLFANMEMDIFKHIKLYALYDVFRFPWLKYGVNAPSSGSECSFQMNYSVGRDNIVLRYKRKTREKNVASDDMSIYRTSLYQKSQLRLQISKKQAVLSTKTTLEGNEYGLEQTQTFGLALAQDIAFEPIEGPLTFNVHVVVFNTGSYENRFFFWEKDLPGSFAMPMLYGQGWRFSFFVAYDLPFVSIRIKIGDILQPESDTIGNGLEQIKGNRRTEGGIQLNWKI
jgi:hypothetical protein